MPAQKMGKEESKFKFWESTKVMIGERTFNEEENLHART